MQIADGTVWCWTELQDAEARELLELLECPGPQLTALVRDAARLPIAGLVLQHNGGGAVLPELLPRIAHAARHLGLQIGLSFKVRGRAPSFEFDRWMAAALGELAPEVVIVEAETWTKTFPNGGQNAVTAAAVDALLVAVDGLVAELGVVAQRLFWPATYQWHPSFVAAQRIAQRGWGRFNYLCDLLELGKRLVGVGSPWKVDAHSARVPQGLTLRQAQFLAAHHQVGIVHYGFAGVREALLT